MTTAPPRTLAALAERVAVSTRAAADKSSRDARAVFMDADRAAVTAALVDLTTTELEPPGTYLNELDNMTRFGMPTVEAFTTVSVTRWPPKQRSIETWGTAGKQTAEKGAIPSSSRSIGYTDVPGSTYAEGNDVSLQAIEDNGEQVLSELFEMYAELVGNAINADAIAAIDAAAVSGGTGVSLDAVGGALGQVVGRGLGNPVIVAAPDVWGKLWALTAAGGPALARLSGMDMTPPVIPDAQIAAGTYYVGARRAFRTYLNGLARLRAVEVSLLGINVGVYQRAAFRVSESGALIKLTSA